MRFFTTTAVAAILAAPGIAMAQTATEQAQGGFGTGSIQVDRVVQLNQWGSQDLYAEGWSADEFIDEMEVYGAEGEDIGDIEDIIVDADGKVISVIAEIGGFLDIGDTHVAIPWDQVEADFAGERVHVPVTEETVDDYDPFTYGVPAGTLTAERVSEEVAMGVDDVATGPRSFRVSELIGDYARIQSGEMGQQTGQAQETGEVQQTDEMQPGQMGAPTLGARPGMMNYGYVSDVIIRDDEIAAVVVEPRGAYGPGYRAYPYYGYDYDYGWEPGYEYYDMPYTEQEIGEAEPFEYQQLELQTAE